MRPSSHLSIHYGFPYTFYILIFIRWTIFLSSFCPIYPFFQRDYATQLLFIASAIIIGFAWTSDTCVYIVRTLSCAVWQTLQNTFFPWFTIRTFIFSKVLQLRVYIFCNNLIADNFTTTNIVQTTLIIYFDDLASESRVSHSLIQTQFRREFKWRS